MNENTLRLVLENDSYSQVKEVYWNDNRVGAVRVDVSFSAGKFPYVRVEMAMIDGVKILHHCQAVRITNDFVKCVKVEKIIAEDDSVSFEEDFQSSFEVLADSVIIAIGQGPGSDAVSGGSLKVTQRGLLHVDEFGRTSQKGVFAAGDIVTGPKTVVEAVAFAKKVSATIEEYCNNG